MTNQEIQNAGISLVQKPFKVLGHKINYLVAATSVDFNAIEQLSTNVNKRVDAAVDEANNNIVYRSMNPDTRYTFLHGREEEKDEKGLVLVHAINGVEQLVDAMLKKHGHTDGFSRKTEVVLGKDKQPKKGRDGEEVTRYSETEQEFYDRAIATLVKNKVFASEDLALAHFQPLIESIALEVPFDVSEREAGERGPKKLAEKFKLSAAKTIVLNRIDKCNNDFLSKIGKSFTPTNDLTVAYSGKFEHGGKEHSFSISDKDATALGWMLKEWSAWHEAQALGGLNE